MEDAVVVFDQEWDEKAELKSKTSSVVKHSTCRGLSSNLPKNGNIESQVKDLATPLLCHVGSGNSQVHIEDPFNAHMQREIKITKIPIILEPLITCPNSPQKSTQGQQSLTNEFQVINNTTPLNLVHTVLDDLVPITQLLNPDYRVEFPLTEIAASIKIAVLTTIAPLLGLSPILTVTSDLDRIHLKHRLDLLEDD
ncbi:hypothetical protein K1719_031940 [Acacia pycnantha]|nr:hypothetical protein K1719_031940 [Acacia pycnantha]